MRRTLAAVSFLLTAGVALTGCAQQSQGPENPIVAGPYCMVQREDRVGFDREGHSEWLTVSGPAGGDIAVDGQEYGSLGLIDGDMAEEVQPDAGPYNGIQYNVPGGVEGGAIVTVDGYPCQST